VALTSVNMKLFKRLVLAYLKDITGPLLDPFQFVYRAKRLADNVVNMGLHYILQHLDRPGTYRRILFVDFSSSFNTIIPDLLLAKLTQISVPIPICQWITSFLTDRQQIERVGKLTSRSLTISTGASQGCVLSPLLFSLYTNNCTSKYPSVNFLKFADDTSVISLIQDGDDGLLYETAYLQEVKNLEGWCQENNLLLNVSKTKELIVDFSTKQERSYQPLNICGTPVERVDSFRYLGVHITQDLSWSCHINTLVKKARQCLYHLRRLRDFKLPSQVLKTFYTCTIESVLTGSITSWFGNSTMQDRRALQRVVRSAERTIHTELPDLQDIYSMRCRTRARKIVKDLSHPNNGLFSLLRSGKRFRSLKATTERMRRSFFPQAIRSLNQETS
ncbi:gastrula zinc finger protein XlCGF28.1-like, partial [Silurus meridionalis]